MKKKSLIISFMFLSIILTGCQQTNDKKGVQEATEIDKLGTQDEVTEGDFIYRLVTEKAKYSENEPINVYAELEYIGDKEKIIISHADSPFYFPMTETTRDYEISYNMNEPLRSTEMIKGEPLRQEYRGSGGYGSEDEKEFKEFMQQIMNQQFPEGNYVVKGFADFFVTENDDIEQKQDYKIEAQIEFSVSNSN